MSLDVPNEVQANLPEQAVLFSTDLDAIVQGINGEGVSTGCAVAWSSGLTISIAIGVVRLGGINVDVVAGNLTADAADPTYTRIDIVVVNSASVKSIVTGTWDNFHRPIMPAIPADSILLAALYIEPGVTSLASTRIVDKRVFTLSGTAMVVHDNDYHNPDYEEEGVAAGLIAVHDAKASPHTGHLPIVGSDGEPGEEGQMGPPGPVGAIGPSGLMGPPGLDGEEGEPSLTIPGPIGDKGDVGPRGDPGLDGEEGEPGVMGPPGVAGHAGVAGIMGPPGLDGQDGEIGSPGPPGPVQTGIRLDPLPGGDHTGNGVICPFVAGENLVFGDACYYKSDGKMWKADATVVATTPTVGLALATIAADATGDFLIMGIARDDTWAWTVGGLVFLSETAGGLVQTAPTGTDTVTQVLGVATHANRILWNQQLIQVEHV